MNSSRLSAMRRRHILAGATAIALCTVFQPVQAQDDAHYGGTMKLLSVAAGGTLDPHINYTAIYWELYGFLYDGLVTFKKVGGADSAQVVPDLAEALPEVTNDGKT